MAGRYSVDDKDASIMSGIRWAGALILGVLLAIVAGVAIILRL